jgi:general secretion pathway protein G
MIVVSILGILAAIVLPHFQDHQRQAREAAAKDILRTVRGQIELYKIQHNGLAPGYVKMGTGAPTEANLSTFTNQLVGTSALTGMATVSKVPAGIYVCGPYLNKLPVNPFNGLNTIKFVTDFVADADNSATKTGWLYKRNTAEFRLNKTGTDLAGVTYLSY